MSSLVVLGIGSLLLLANLSLCAVLAPSFTSGGGSPGARLRKTWLTLLLALIQVFAWAVIFYQGGAVKTPALAFEEALACFSLMGGAADGLDGPWSALVPFVALNGLLFVPVSLIVGFVPEWRVVQMPASAEVAGREFSVAEIPAEPKVAPAPAPVELRETPPALPTQAPTPAPAAPIAPAPTAPAIPTQVQIQKPAPAAKVAPARRTEPFRGSLPPIHFPTQEPSEIELPVFDPERPPERIPPTPPPIRFGS
jgi:hypothetical protein